jgi:hypothetical protein
MNKTEILNLIVGDITGAQAKELYDCKWWEQFTKSQAAFFQLHRLNVKVVLSINQTAVAFGING